METLTLFDTCDFNNIAAPGASYAGLSTFEKSTSSYGLSWNFKIQLANGTEYPLNVKTKYTAAAA